MHKKEQSSHLVCLKSNSSCIKRFCDVKMQSKLLVTYYTLDLNQTFQYSWSKLTSFCLILRVAHYLTSLVRKKNLLHTIQISLKFNEILLAICATNDLLTDNFRRNIASKVSKLSKIIFSMECGMSYTSFFGIIQHDCQMLLFGWSGGCSL